MPANSVAILSTVVFRLVPPAPSSTMNKSPVATAAPMSVIPSISKLWVTVPSAVVSAFNPPPDTANIKSSPCVMVVAVVSVVADTVNPLPIPSAPEADAAQPRTPLVCAVKT